MYTGARACARKLHMWRWFDKHGPIQQFNATRATNAITLHKMVAGISVRAHVCQLLRVCADMVEIVRGCLRMCVGVCLRAHAPAAETDCVHRLSCVFGPRAVAADAVRIYHVALPREGTRRATSQ